MLFKKKNKKRIELTQRELLETLLKEQKKVSSSNLDEQVKKLEELKKQLLK